MKTTAEKIAVMQAYEGGKRVRSISIWGDTTYLKRSSGELEWNWKDCNYDVVPDEPEKPKVEEYAIEKVGDEYGFCLDGGRWRTVDLASKFGFVFVHVLEDGREVKSSDPIMWHYKDELTNIAWVRSHVEATGSSIPKMAAKVRKVL